MEYRRRRDDVKLGDWKESSLLKFCRGDHTDRGIADVISSEKNAATAAARYHRSANAKASDRRTVHREMHVKVDVLGLSDGRKRGTEHESGAEGGNVDIGKAERRRSKRAREKNLEISIRSWTRRETRTRDC